jgi:hypothetical protein
VEKAYLRILSQSILDCVKDGCPPVIDALGAAPGAVDSLDLSGTGREFVTPELAEELLQPMLAEDMRRSRAPSPTVAACRL